MAPLKGELSAKLTEGFGLAISQALRRRRKCQASQTSGSVFRLRRRLFGAKSQTPQTRLSPGQLPFQGSLLDILSIILHLPPKEKRYTKN